MIPTFTHYLKSFTNLRGVFQAALGLAAVGFSVFDYIAPPGKPLWHWTLLVLALALLLTYCVFSVAGVKTERPAKLGALLALLLGAGLIGDYFLASQKYIFDEEIRGANRRARAVVADSSCYTEAAKTIAQNSPEKPNRRQMIEGYTLSRLDSLFEEECLRATWLRLAGSYLLAAFTVFICFCSLSYAEAVAVPARP